ncbi:MAG: hypothetical protein AAGI48_15185 [Verrucomicrobiota bacterium]
MIRTDHPRLSAAVVSLGVGLLLLAITPRVGFLEEADRRWFGLLSGKGDAVVGKGSVDDPRRTEELMRPTELAPAGILFLDEDPDEYFEAVPPVPTDVAVVLSRLKELDAESVGFSYPLFWEEPDTLAIEAMRATMDRLPGVVLGFQLINGTSAEPVAAPFQLCSIPYTAVVGDRSRLPVVNSLPGDFPEFGGRQTLAGFTVLASETQEKERAYLLARWDDRVVFALPVASEIARLGVKLDEVVVEPGKELRLGPDGPRIPIDFRGRIDLPDEQPEMQKTPATAMISRDLPEGFGASETPVYLTDERLGVSKFERQWNELLPAIDAVVRGAPRRVGLAEVPRPGPVAEMIALLAVTLAGCWLLSGRDVVRRLVKAGVFCVVVALGLTLVIRLASVAPMPLAFQMVPVTALLMVLLMVDRGGVDVVRAKSSEPETAKPEPPRRKPRKKRRKR